MGNATVRPFNRYDHAEAADASIGMPRDALGANTSALQISEIVRRFEEYSKDPGAAQAQYPWASRFVMGYPLPSFQRPSVWTSGQQRRFIQSIWEGIDLGSFLINDVYELMPDGRGGDCFREFSDALLDGQQRLTALQNYLLDGFPMPDATGVDRHWSQLPRIERRRFEGA